MEWVESEWDEQERAWMLALAEWEVGRCAVCGGDPAECQSPDSDRNNPRAAWMYRADTPVECHRSTAHRVAAEQHEKQAPEDRRVLIFPVTRRSRGRR